MKRRRLIAALFWTVLLVACGGRPGGGEDGTTVPRLVGVTTGALEHDGIVRSYRLFVPDDLQAPSHLVIGLHGGLGSGEQFAEATGYDTLAAQKKFVMVYPDGVNRTWNGGRCCGRAQREDIDDVGFLAALVEHLAQRIPIDSEHVFMTGHSNGAIMTFRFACERADLVAAVAPVAGSLEIGDCPATRGVSLLLIHGDSDLNHPLEGGEGERSLAGVAFASVGESMARWTEAMGCEAPEPSTEEGPLTTTEWPSCRDGTLARTVIIAGADHPWPGGTVGAPEIQGTPSNDLDATAATWAFFAESPPSVPN